MVQMNIAEAREKLSQLLAAVEAGEEVVIARSGVPAARLVPVPASIPGKGVRLGLLKGLVEPDTLPDFTAPMSDKELAEWED